MTRLSRLAAVLPLAAAAAFLTAGTAGASTSSLGPEPACDGTFSYGGTTVTVRCTTAASGTEFRAMALCPNGDWHFGPFVPQGAGHVSVASCANPMTRRASTRGREVAYGQAPTRQWQHRRAWGGPKLVYRTNADTKSSPSRPVVEKVRLGTGYSVASPPKSGKAAGPALTEQ